MVDDSAMASLSAHCIQAVWTAPENVSALTTTRNGGVSIGPYESMNLGLHVGDEHEAVLENRRLLLQHIPAQTHPLWLNQTHSNVILKAEQPCDSNNADGAYTTSIGKVLTVLTADCLPVVLTNGAGTELAVVHAGWRGLAKGIVRNAVNCFLDRVDMHAWLGPAIGPTAFEVGEDVKRAFVSKMASHEQFFKPELSAEKYWCDLYAITASELRELGCSHISGGDYCTYTQKTTFHSYRRDGKSSGRMATLAWLS